MKQEAKIYIQQGILRLLEMNVYEKNKILEDLTKYIIPMGVENGLEFSDKSIDFEVDNAIAQYQSTAKLGDTLINDNDQDFDKNWLENSGIDFDNENSYLKQYVDYLTISGFAGGSKSIINNIKETSKAIIKYSGNPADKENWDRRGLLIGSVQSGKTANYTGIIHAASDVGYKIIILISGTSNLLRQQTQERIEEYYVGTCTKQDTKGRQEFGISKNRKDYKKPHIQTTWDKDFVGDKYVNVNPFSNNESPHIFVIKKQKTVLEKIIKLFKDYQNVSNLPVLIIDDEGDLASIDTNYEKDFDGDVEEYSPTTTNKLIRNLLTCFKRRTFLSVTATPFANIFIDPDLNTNNKDLQKDLFPKDFIHALRPPLNYFGGKKVFGLDEDDLYDEDSEELYEEFANGANYTSIIDDIVPALADDIFNERTGKYMRTRPKPKGADIEFIPRSMKNAICNFIIAKSIRSLRGDRESHASMMINVTVKVDLIERVKDLVIEYVGELKTEISNYASLPFETAKKNSDHIKDLYREFLKSFPNIDLNNKNEGCKFLWQEIQKELNETIRNVEIMSSSGGSSDTIDFKDNHNKPKTYIIIGGFTLSRGFTMEGLMVSYLYRTSKAMDTLYQMGRWFGYRVGYEDLCQLFLEKQTRDYFVATVRATENLMTQVRQMNRQGSSPQDFGMYVLKESENLEISARNKIKSSERLNYQVDYSGKQKDLSNYGVNETEHEKNKKNIHKFIKTELTKNETVYNNNNNYYYKDISTEKILEFINEYSISPNASKETKNCLKQYIEDNYKNKYCDVLLLNKTSNNISNSNTEFIPFTRKSWKEQDDQIYNSNSKAFSDYSHFFPNISTVGELTKELKDNGFIDDHKEFIKTKNEKKNYRDIFVRYRKTPLLVIGLLEVTLNSSNKKLNIPTIGFQFPYGGKGHSSVRILNIQAQREFTF